MASPARWLRACEKSISISPAPRGRDVELADLRVVIASAGEAIQPYLKGLDCFVALLPCANALRLSQAMTSSSRLQNQLLHAPVQELGDIQHVLRRTRHRVNPAELLQLLAGLAEHAQHLAVEAELVDAARPGV